MINMNILKNIVLECWFSSTCTRMFSTCPRPGHKIKLRMQEKFISSGHLLSDVGWQLDTISNTGIVRLLCQYTMAADALSPWVTRSKAVMAMTDMGRSLSKRTDFNYLTHLSGKKGYRIEKYTYISQIYCKFSTTTFKSSSSSSSELSLYWT